MKKIIFLLLLFPVLVQSQEIFQKEITHTIPFSISDIVALQDDGYLGCGTVAPSSWDSAMSVIFKTDSLLQVQWCKRLKMLRMDDFMCITQLSDGNFLTAGASRYEFSTDYGGSLYKLDDSGNIIWNRLYSKDYDDRTIGVFEQGDQTLVLFIRHGVFGEPTKIVKTDATGNILNQFTILTLPSNKGGSGEGVTGDMSGNYFLAGTSSYNAVGENIYFIAKTTDNSLVWYKEYDFGRDNAQLRGIATLSDGDIVVTGSVADAINTGMNNIGVMRIDPMNGSVIWAREIMQADSYNQNGQGILPLSNNEMVVYGRANTVNGTQAFAARLDADGNVSWAMEYGSGTYNYFTVGQAVSLDRHLFIGKNSLYGGTYIAQAAPDGSTPCYSENLDLTSYEMSVNVLSPETVIDDPGVQVLTPSYEVTDLTLSEEVFCTGTVAVKEFPTVSSFRICPNPAHDHITVENLNGSTENTIEIVNMNGGLCYQSILTGQKEMINIDLVPGIYFIKISNPEGTTFYGQKVIIIK